MAGVRGKRDPSRGARRGGRAAGRDGGDALRDCVDGGPWPLEPAGDELPSDTMACSRHGRGRTARRRRRVGCTDDTLSGGGAGRRRRSARGDLRLDNEPEPWHNSRDRLALSELGAVTRAPWAIPGPQPMSESALYATRTQRRRPAPGPWTPTLPMDAKSAPSLANREDRGFPQRPPPSRFPLTKIHENRCRSRPHRQVSRIRQSSEAVDIRSLTLAPRPRRPSERRGDTLSPRRAGRDPNGEPWFRPRILSYRPPRTLLPVVGQHSPGSLNPVAQPVLKRNVTLAFLDMLSDRGADHVRNRLTVDSRDRVQLLRLVGSQADRHGFHRFHDADRAAQTRGLSPPCHRRILVSLTNAGHDGSRESGFRQVQPETQGVHHPNRPTGVRLVGGEDRWS